MYVIKEFQRESEVIQVRYSLTIEYLEQGSKNEKFDVNVKPKGKKKFLPVAEDPRKTGRDAWYLTENEIRETKIAYLEAVKQILGL